MSTIYSGITIKIPLYIVVLTFSKKNGIDHGQICGFAQKKQKK